eukprot:702319-Amphidinium_carterae.1
MYSKTLSFQHQCKFSVCCENLRCDPRACAAVKQLVQHIMIVLGAIVPNRTKGVDQAQLKL